MANKIDIVVKYDAEKGDVYTPSGRVFLAKCAGLEHAELAKLKKPTQDIISDLNWWLSQNVNLFEGKQQAFEMLQGYIKALEAEHGKSDKR